MAAYLDRAVAGHAPPVLVRLRQRGTMRRGPGEPWIAFRAVQDFRADEPSFSWRAWVRQGPLVVRVEDSFRRGEGGLRVRLFGLFGLADLRGPDITTGQLQRWLAEIPWNPGAGTYARGLAWSPTGAREGVLSCAGAGVTCRFDADGDLVEATAHRPRAIDGGRTVPTPWGGRFSTHETMGPLRVPRHAEVWWDLPTGRFTYWRGEVLQVETL